MSCKSRRPRSIGRKCWGGRVRCLLNVVLFHSRLALVFGPVRLAPTGMMMMQLLLPFVPVLVLSFRVFYAFVFSEFQRTWFLIVNVPSWVLDIRFSTSSRSTIFFSSHVQYLRCVLSPPPSSSSMADHQA